MASPAGYRVNAITLSFTLIAGAIVSLRLFARIVLMKNAGFEDFCIAFAMVCSIALTVAIADQIRNGMGRHIYELDHTQMINSQKAFWASIWIYNLSLMLTKMSMLTQYLRIFRSRRFRIVCSVVLGFVTAYGVWAFAGSIMLCYPVAFFWDKTIQDGKCLNPFVVWFLNAGVNILQDFIILSLPLPLLRRLKIPKRQKQALIVIFVLGGFVCLISSIRLRTLVSIANSKDPTYDNPPAATLSAVEANVGIICACLPSMGPLLSTMFPTYFLPSKGLDNGRIQDEERHKHTRTLSATTRPDAAGGLSKPSHTRGRNTVASPRLEGEPEEYYNQQATVLGAELVVNGQVRQITINTVRRPLAIHPPRTSRQVALTPTPRLPPYNALAPRLPRLPENMAVIGPVYIPNRQSRSSRDITSNRAAIQQKPLPVTPFPVLPESFVESWFVDSAPVSPASANSVVSPPWPMRV